VAGHALLFRRKQAVGIWFIIFAAPFTGMSGHVEPDRLPGIRIFRVYRMESVLGVTVLTEPDQDRVRRVVDDILGICIGHAVAIIAAGGDRTITAHVV
jgi:hypothetical protein